MTTGHRSVGRADERVVPVGPLSPPAATQLVLACAEAVRPGSAAHVETSVVRALVEHLDGLPLALELAGARLWSLGADESRWITTSPLRTGSSRRYGSQRPSDSIAQR